MKIFTLDFAFGTYAVNGVSLEEAIKASFAIATRNLERGESCDCIFRNKKGERITKEFIRA